MHSAYYLYLHHLYSCCICTDETMEMPCMGYVRAVKNAILTSFTSICLRSACKKHIFRKEDTWKAVPRGWLYGLIFCATGKIDWPAHGTTTKYLAVWLLSCCRVHIVMLCSHRIQNHHYHTWAKLTSYGKNQSCTFHIIYCHWTARYDWECGARLWVWSMSGNLYEEQVPQLVVYK